MTFLPTVFRVLMAAVAVALVSALPVSARIDLSTLSDSRQIQATIYNDADLTLIRDRRTLPLSAGLNQVQFSWANTRIDPTSLSLDIMDSALPVAIEQVRFPPHARGLGIWQIRAGHACQVPVALTYFTSGISWQAAYKAFLSPDRSQLHLTGFVRINNQSGEDFHDAGIRLVVGRIHLLDRIADLAGRPHPHGQPETRPGQLRELDSYAKGKVMLESAPAVAMAAPARAAQPRRIEKKGISEFFLYTIEGTQTLEHGWSRQLLSMDIDNIPVRTVYAFDTERFGTRVMQTLSFSNTAESGLGQVPLPKGEVMIFHRTGPDGGLTHAGSDTCDYIPVGQEIRLKLGTSPRVRVTPTIMAYEKRNLRFDTKGNLSGFDDIRRIAVKIVNFTDEPARFDIHGRCPGRECRITEMTGQDRFETIDQHRFICHATLAPNSRQTVHYTLTTSRGD